MFPMAGQTAGPNGAWAEFFVDTPQRRALQLVIIFLLIIIIIIIIDIIRTLRVSIVGRAPSFFMIILLQNT